MSNLMETTAAFKPLSLRLRVGSFSERLRPAPVNGGFRMKDHWVWGGSVVRGEDGLYHLFVSVWSKRLPFWDGYITSSRVVRATSAIPEGPYHYAQEILPPRGADFWDGRMTHNPEIHCIGDQYVLFYIGSTYPEPMPSNNGAIPESLDRSAIWLRTRIGVATAPSVHGPWRRLDAPVLEPRPDKWDAIMVTNPTACVRSDGRILMLYRSSNHDSFCQLGVTLAERPEGPYCRLSDGPILSGLVSEQNAIEDPFIWHNGSDFELIAKDLDGRACGELNAGIHALSPNGIDWKLAPSPRAYSRTVRWDDDTVTRQGCFERPKLLIENGVPTHLFAATGDGPGGFDECTQTWNMVTPLG